MRHIAVGDAVVGVTGVPVACMDCPQMVLVGE